MADATKRVNYFDRQFLRAPEFRDQQDYDLDRRRRHNRLLHSPGIAEGLAVTANVGDGFVTVSAGTAYNALGQEIVLPASQQVDVSALSGAAAYITIAYTEQATDPSTDPGVAGTSTRISEQPALSAGANAPGNPNINIVLAQVPLAGNKVSGSLDATGRVRAGTLLGDDLTARSMTLKNDAVASSQWPKMLASQTGDVQVMTGAQPTERVRVTAGGNVGIGTATPSRELTIEGTSGTYMNVRDTGDPNGPYEVLLGVDQSGGIVSTMSNHDLQLRSGANNTHMVLKANGSVGIGTATPSRELTIEGASATYMNVRDTGDPNGPYEVLLGVDQSGGIVSTMSNHDLQLRSGANNTHMVLKANGSVGIGTATPSRELTIEGASATYMNVRDTGDPNGPYEVLLGVDQSGGIVSTMSNHDLQLRSGANNTHMVIKANGHVGIGTLSPDFILDVTDRIRLRQGSNGTAGIWLFQTGPGDRAFIGMAGDAQVGMWGNNGAGWGLVMDTSSGNVGIGIGQGAPAAKLDVGGSAHASAFPTSSDARFKKNVAPVTDVLEKLEQIQGVTFEWNETYEALGRSTGRREMGVLAQDVESVFPELVSTWGDEEYRAVDYGRFTAVLVEAVKELKAANEALEKRVDALEKMAGSSRGGRGGRQSVQDSSSSEGN